jgi:hypothetical protein
MFSINFFIIKVAWLILALFCGFVSIIIFNSYYIFPKRLCKANAGFNLFSAWFYAMHLGFSLVGFYVLLEKIYNYETIQSFHENETHNQVFFIYIVWGLSVAYKFRIAFSHWLLEIQDNYSR